MSSSVKGLASETAVATPAVALAASQTSNVLKVAKDIFAGTCGGIAVTMVGHPFDTLKVRLQMQPVDKPIYNGMIDCARKTIQWEGVMGLYKGVQSPLVGQMFFRASMFMAFGSCKRWLGTNSDGTPRPLSTLDYYIAGCLTGFAVSFTEGPIDFYKSQVQMQIIRQKMDPNYKPPFNTMLQCVKQTFKINGLRAPFQGIVPTMCRNTPANAAYLGTFEVFKKYAADNIYHCSNADLPAWVILTAGGLGGVLYWCMIYPIDVIKSSMMTDHIDPKQRKYPNMVSTFNQLWAEGGIKRFYRGFTPCIIRAAPANAACLYTVDRVQEFLKRN
eukprot:TRINITY_DN2428_c0_g1_i5.p1 TRINITY_DN2428_c0_g1~~TRINITY_DN2428_c0_g1_i5.p1  ORF type:complete len:378 (-),score=16.30 TRINITY_DN2428_c0_g1_i5:430-1419(-)